MKHSIRTILPSALAFASLILVGCSGQPEAVDIPPIQPDEAAQGALEAYDTNHDGQLSMDELAACPGIRDAIGQYDKNGDQQVSKEELSERFAIWVKGGVGVTTMACAVSLNGKPLADARVELIPEPFFANTIQPATGVTGSKGTTILGIDTTHLPEDMKNMRGLVHQGVFRVKITHPKIDILPKYNSETILGREISADTGENVLRWNLSSQ